jgi:hypothetical protein
VLSAGALYVRPDGIPVGTGQNIIDGKLTSALWVESDRSFYMGNFVWTGSTAIDRPASAAGVSCDDWTTALSTGQWATPAIAPDWFSGVVAPSCVDAPPIFCIEQHR